MKTSLLFASVALLCASAFAEPTPVGIDSPALTIDGNRVALGFNISAVAPSPPAVHDVRILFCDCTVSRGGFTELSTLQPFPDWYLSHSTNKTTAKEMLLDGWSIQSVAVSSVASGGQFYIVFVK